MATEPVTDFSVALQGTLNADADNRNSLAVTDSVTQRFNDSTARSGLSVTPAMFYEGGGDYASACNRAIAALNSNGGGELFIPNGDWPASGETILLNKAGIDITGPGYLVDATIHVGKTFAEVNGNPSAILFYNAKISCGLKTSTPSTTLKAIELQYVRDFKISANIRGYGYGIYGLAGNNGEVFGQMTARIDVSGTNFVDCVNPIMSVRNSTGPTLQHADWTINNSYQTSSSRTIRNVDLDGMDGVVISSSYMFMAGFNESFADKRQNIRLTRSVNIMISANQLFEPGAEFVLLDRCQRFSVTGNGMYYGGQVVPSAAVRITGGDQSGAAFCIGSIAGNNGLSVTGNFCDIEGPSGYVTVIGNEFRQPGDTGFYYGSLPLPSTIYGVYADATSTQVHADVRGITYSGTIVPFSLLGTSSTGFAASGTRLSTSSTISALSFASSTDAGRSVSWGSGTPEGVVTGQTGSVYGRETGGVGITLASKESGNGNTGWAFVQMRRSGNTASRPGSLGANQTGLEYFDTTLSKPVWWTGVGWVDATGTAA